MPKPTKQKRLESPDECYIALCDALDLIKAVQAFRLRMHQGDGAKPTVDTHIGEARAALDVACEIIEGARRTLAETEGRKP